MKLTDDEQKMLDGCDGPAVAKAMDLLMRYGEALTHLEKARQLDPMSFTLPGIFIAQIHAIQGDTAGAIAEYREFLKIHPGHPSMAFVERQLLELESHSKASH